MGYIVDLTVILYDIFRSAVDDTTAKTALNYCAESSLENFKTHRHSQIHKDIRDFVEEAFKLQTTTEKAREKDMFLKKVDDLIKHNCVPLK